MDMVATQNFHSVDRLLAAPQETFDGDEDDAGKRQVEEEPVQAEVDVAFEVEPARSPRASEQCRDQNERQQLSRSALMQQHVDIWMVLGERR